MTSKMYVFLIDNLTAERCSRDTGVCLAMVQSCKPSLIPTCTCHHGIVLTSWILLTAILFYDYGLTLGEEIDLFWKQSRRSWPFVLFTFTRYITLLNHILVLAYTFWQLPGSVCALLSTANDLSLNNSICDYRCKHWISYAIQLLTPLYQMQVCHYVQQCSGLHFPGNYLRCVDHPKHLALLVMDIVVLMCMRVYALYNQSRSVMILLIVLVMSLAGLTSVCELAIDTPLRTGLLTILGI